MSHKRNWVVTIKEVITREVYCYNCTEEQARKNTWDFTKPRDESPIIESEIADVVSVEPNEEERPS